MAARVCWHREPLRALGVSHHGRFVDAMQHQRGDEQRAHRQSPDVGDGIRTVHGAERVDASRGEQNHYLTSGCLERRLRA